MGHHPRIMHQLENLEEPTGRTFEKLVRDVMERHGTSARLTPRGPDGGRDVIAEGPPPFETRYMIQVKHTARGHNISHNTCERYARHAHHVENNEAAVVTNSDFTGPAYKEAKIDGLKLINGESLADFIINLNATDILNRYYERPTITTVEEMLDVIDALGRMERVVNEDGAPDFSPLVTQGQMDTNTDSERLNVYCDAIRGLFEFGFLDESDLPIQTSARAHHRYLLNTEPIHSDGSPMKVDEHILLVKPDIYLNHHDTYPDKRKSLRYLAEYCVDKMRDEQSVTTVEATAEQR